MFPVVPKSSRIFPFLPKRAFFFLFLPKPSQNCPNRKWPFVVGVGLWAKTLFSMAKVVEGFLLGTHDDLTFYLLDGNLYVRMKSSLTRKKVKYSPRFVRTMQSANELGRASKIASRIYKELSREQRRMVFVLYKKMTGVAKLALKYG